MAVAFVLPGTAGPVPWAPVAAPAQRARGAEQVSWSSSLVAPAALLTAAAACRGHTARRALKRTELLRGLGGAALIAPEVVLAKSQQEAVDELNGYAMAAIAPKEAEPTGWNWIVEGVGLTQDAYMNNAKFRTAEPTVVRFLAPPFWNLKTPDIDYNGASGTVQINNYAKGDSATVFVDVDFKGNLKDMKIKDFKQMMFRALTLKGTASLVDQRVTKVEDGPEPNYKFLNIEWTLYTGAGFEIDRNGYAMVTQLTDGGPLTVFWGGVVNTRFVEMKDTINQVIQSFRAMKVPEGIRVEMRKEYKDFNTNFVEKGRER